MSWKQFCSDPSARATPMGRSLREPNVRNRFRRPHMPCVASSKCKLTTVAFANRCDRFIFRTIWFDRLVQRDGVILTLDNRNPFGGPTHPSCFYTDRPLLSAKNALSRPVEYANRVNKTSGSYNWLLCYINNSGHESHPRLLRLLRPCIYAS